MCFKLLKFFLTPLALAIFLLVSCTNGNNTLKPANNNFNFHNKQLSNKNGAVAAAAVDSFNDITILRTSIKTFTIKIGNSIIPVIIEDPDFLTGECIKQVVYLKTTKKDVFVSVITRSEKYIYTFKVNTLANIHERVVNAELISKLQVPNGFNVTQLLRLNEKLYAIITPDILSVEGQHSLFCEVVDNNFTNLYSADLHFVITKAEYDKEKQKIKLTLNGPCEAVIFVWIDQDHPNAPEEYEDDLPGGFPGVDLQANSLFFGSGVSIPMTALYLTPATSGMEQPIALCPNSESGPCTLTQLDNENPIAVVVSNLKFNSESASESNSPINLALTTNGEVYQLENNISATPWKHIYSLNINLGTNGSAYSAYNGMFYVIGTSTSSNNLGATVLEASEDGRFWEDTNVYSFRSIAATPNSYCAIENDPSDPLGFGQVSCWGSNSENKLGLGNLESSSPARALIPAKIGIAQGETSPISYLSLAGGSYHMCALRTSLDKVDCWGHSGFGELGDGHNYDPNSSTPVATPVAIPNISGKIRALVAGGSHNCILDTKGQAWCWGSNQYGEINTTNTVTKYTSPTFAYYNSPFHYLSIGAGRDFTCATTATQVNCWGNNYSYPFKSMQISLSQDSNFTAISAGGGNACVLSNKVHSGNTNAWCWGDNSYGQLGNGESGGFSYTPQPVISKSNPIIFSSISQSGVTTCGIESGTGHTYCWGNNQALQTGIPDKSIVVTPDSAIKLNGTPGVFSNVSEGILSTCLISNETNESGSIIHNTYCLGSNSLGQLGIGSTNNESQPVLVNTMWW